MKYDTIPFMSNPRTIDPLTSGSKDTFPLSAGDRVRVYVKIKEGDRERAQPFEGTIIAVRGRGINRTFTVRRVGVGSVGVERIFPASSPYIAKVDVLGTSKVRRAKLYYLRSQKGKVGRL